MAAADAAADAVAPSAAGGLLAALPAPRAMADTPAAPAAGGVPVRQRRRDRNGAAHRGWQAGGERGANERGGAGGGVMIATRV